MTRQLMTLRDFLPKGRDDRAADAAAVVSEVAEEVVAEDVEVSGTGYLELVLRIPDGAGADVVLVVDDDDEEEAA